MTGKGNGSGAILAKLIVFHVDRTTRRRMKDAEVSQRVKQPRAMRFVMTIVKTSTARPEALLSKPFPQMEDQKGFRAVVALMI